MNNCVLYKVTVYNFQTDVYSNEPYSNGVIMDGIKEEHMLRLLPTMIRCGLTVVISRYNCSSEE